MSNKAKQLMDDYLSEIVVTNSRIHHTSNMVEKIIDNAKDSLPSDVILLLDALSVLVDEIGQYSENILIQSKNLDEVFDSVDVVEIPF